MTKVESFETAPGLAKPKLAASAVVGKLELHVPLEGLIDIEAEKARLTKEIERLRDFATKLEAKLGNDNYTSRAPAEVVERDRNKLAETKEALARVEAARTALEG